MTSLPQTMEAIAISKLGGPEVLKADRLPVPKPGPGQLLIKVGAAGVNRPDVLQRQGLYPVPPNASPLPGLEAAGEVVSVGADCKRYRLGDQVTALLNGGGYAEFALVQEGAALPKPDRLSLIEAAAMPETVFTVWHNVFERGHLQAGETLLVHGGASGIGTTAIQIAKALGATVIVTARSADKCAACLKLGADHAINYRDQDFVAAVADLTGGRGADVILDMAGGDYLARNMDAAAVEGRIVQIAFQNGNKHEIDVSKIMVKRLTWTGSTLRPRTDAFKARLAAEVEKHVWPLIAEGTVRPVMDSTFPLREAALAHSRIEDSSHIGKIVLTT
jgi:putative PIG3 family NAD(P)H quinone oxidoreductase